LNKTAVFELKYVKRQLFDKIFSENIFKIATIIQGLNFIKLSTNLTGIILATSGFSNLNPHTSTKQRSLADSRHSKATFHSYTLRAKQKFINSLQMLDSFSRQFIA
jgi:hypothetical protein